jgi:hypothetical protein
MHSHLCPVCKVAYNCKGIKCAPYNGVAHPKCVPSFNPSISKHVVVVNNMPKRGK